jgi:hypothetical protein
MGPRSSIRSTCAIAFRLSLAVERKQVAHRVRVAAARKHPRGKWAAKRKPMRRLGIVGLALLAALISGFLAKRVMIPSVVHYIAYRPPDRPIPPAASEEQGDSDDSAATNGRPSNLRGGQENLTPNDRDELDAIIKRKDK